MAASWAPYGLHSSAIVDSGGRGGIGVIQAGVLGSGNTALDADDDNGLLVTISSGPGAGGGGHSSHLATILDGGAYEDGVGVLSGGADIWYKGGGVLHHSLSTCRGCIGLGSNSGALGCGGAIWRDILNTNSGRCSGGGGADFGNNVDGWHPSHRL
jgi:hypothetical protein